jgi:hypothetical protein
LKDRTGGGYAGLDLSSWVGFANGKCEDTILQIVGDLGSLKAIHSVRALTQSQTASGIFHPSQIRAEVSRDGSDWVAFGATNSFPPDAQDFAVMWGEVLGSATARYVRWTFTYREWLFLAELEVLGSPDDCPEYSAAHLSGMIR